MQARSRAGHRIGWIRVGIAGALAAAAGAALLSVSPSAATAPAALNLEVGALQYSGSGCAHRAELEKLDSPGRFHLEFRDFQMSVAADAPQIASCSLALPIRIPPGVSIRLIGGEWSGHATVAQAGKASVRRAFFFAGQPTSPTRSQAFDAGLDGAFFFRDDLRDELADPTEGWTPCRAEPTQRIARAATELVGEGAGTVLTIHFGNVFDLETRACQVLVR